MPGAPLRVLVAHPFPDLYGADLMLLRSVQALRAAGAEVLLVVPEHGPLLARMDLSHVEWRVVRAPVLRKSLMSARGLLGMGLRLVPDLTRLWCLLREWAPDVIYVNTLTLPHWIAAAWLSNVPSVCHVRELESKTARVIARALTAPLLLTGTIVANSHATRSFLLDLHPRLARRTSVIYNGLSFPEPAQWVAPTRERRRLTVVGRLSPRKGQDTALRAMAELVRRGHDVELELVGSVYPGYEWFEQSLRDLADELKVADRLMLRDFHAHVWPFYAGADVVAVPSRLEPFGSVAVEAMAAGRPVVVTNVGGLPEIVTDGETGLVVRPDDPPALADAVARLLEDPEAAREVASRASSTARARFTLERYERELTAALVKAAASVRA